MACNKLFGKILRAVKKEYPRFSRKRQLKIAWRVYRKQKKE